MKYEVTLEGSFVTDIIVEADNFNEAEKKAEESFNRMIGLDNEDYAVGSISSVEVE